MKLTSLSSNNLDYALYLLFTFDTVCSHNNLTCQLIHNTCICDVVLSKQNQSADNVPLLGVTTFRLLLLLSNKPSQIHSDNPSGHLVGNEQIDSNAERQPILKE